MKLMFAIFIAFLSTTSLAGVITNFDSTCLQLNQILADHPELELKAGSTVDPWASVILREEKGELDFNIPGWNTSDPVPEPWGLLIGSGTCNVAFYLPDACVSVDSTDVICLESATDGQVDKYDFEHQGMHLRTGYIPAANSNYIRLTIPHPPSTIIQRLKQLFSGEVQ